MDFSIVIPSRNEEWLARTISDVLEHSRGDFEIIAVLDGAWALPTIPDHPRVRLTHSARVIGQRAATNLGVRMATGRYVCKLDAHCSVDEGWDVELVTAGDTLGHDVTQIPAMTNLHVFDRICKACGHRMYQGPMEAPCAQCQQVAGFTRDVVWQPRKNRRTEFWRIDHDLHFQYWHDYRRRKEAKGEIVDVMSAIGCCFVMRRERFVELGGLEEAAGSWGGFGAEIALKSWLSGGRHVVNKRTSISHAFRTQGGSWSFPYANPQSAVEKARQYARDLWFNNAWPNQTRPLSWLVDKFAPVPGWHDAEGSARLGQVQSAGLAFARRATVKREPTIGLLYYSDLRGESWLLEAVRAQIQRAKPAGARLVSVTLGPLGFGDVNIALQAERGQLTMFRQILIGLEELDTDLVFFCEHDVWYSAAHFTFRPPSRDRFFYNQHRYQVDVHTGRAVHYLCCQTAELCADRRLLIDHYRKRIAAVEAAGGYQRNMGYEPGTNKWSRSLDGVEHGTWFAPHANLDLRHGRNLSKTRWSQAEFRNKSTCQGWIETDEIPGIGSARAFVRALRPQIEQVA